MPQQEWIPCEYLRSRHPSQSDGSVHLISRYDDAKFNFSFETVRPSIFRVRFHAPSHPLPPYPSAPEKHPDLRDTGIHINNSHESSTSFEIGEVRASVNWQNTPTVSLGWRDAKEPLHQDLPARSYIVDGTGVAHYIKHDKFAFHVGLGEKAAPLDLTGRHFITSATDCFGYDVYRSDPMYKHIPLLIKATPKGCIGIFSTSHSRGTWSVGSEIDGLWGRFKVYRHDYGGLEEYIIIGHTLKEVVRTYAEIVGFPLLVPRWAYGYLSGGYKYTMSDDPPAHQGLLDFAQKLKKYDIPCSAHQMSSGYSISEVEPKVRNVFTWNKHRFPDPEAWLAQFHSLGIRLLANIKPFVLKSHPDYEYLANGGGLFKDDRTQDTGSMQLWSAGGGENGEGSHIDFTCDAAYRWWVRGVQNLKNQGVDAMWNDNNEYTIPNDQWTIAVEGPLKTRIGSSKIPKTTGLWGRGIHTELMGKASYEALLSVNPKERPLVLTRSATPGTMRYACSTWSGDNVTSWEGMKGANAQSLMAGISLLQCYGHDIGGFEGPQPSPELLLRWVQLGIHSPRFAINCFKTSPRDNSVGEVIEPWMYPEIIPQIRDAIKRRYEMMPYIYSLGLESHLTASPPQRWIGWGYESDPEVWSEKLKSGEEQFWFGDSLLVGGVYEPRVDIARMYLPRNNGQTFDYGYVSINTPYEYFASGQWITISSRWRESIPILAKIGGAIPFGKNVQTRMPGETNPTCQDLEEDNYRGVEIFPPKASSHDHVFSYTWLEDDGISQEPDISSFTVTYSSTAEKVTVGFHVDQGNIFEPPWQDLDFVLLPGDERYLVSDTGIPLDRLEADKRGRPRFRMRNPPARKGPKSKNGELSNGYNH